MTTTLGAGTIVSRERRNSRRSLMRVASKRLMGVLFTVALMTVELDPKEFVVTVPKSAAWTRAGQTPQRARTVLLNKNIE